MTSATHHARSGRLRSAFERLAGQGRQALIPYICCGDPSADGTVDVMHALVEGGCDILEVGVPFSDPMADGPVIQQASERALRRGVGTRQVLDTVRRFRERDADTPVVLMGYANPVERHDLTHGAGAFVRDAAAAGVDGLLIVDYPPEEVEDFAAAARAAGVDMIFLLAPTSTEARMQQVGRIATGYVYHVSLKGVTGAGHFDIASVAEAMGKIRRHVRVPVGVGFGIRDGETARQVAEVADAVVIGSRLVQAMADAGPEAAPAVARDFAASIRRAMDAGKTMTTTEGTQA